MNWTAIATAVCGVFMGLLVGYFIGVETERRYLKSRDGEWLLEDAIWAKHKRNYPE